MSLDKSAVSSVLQPYVDRHELAGAVTLVANKDQILSLEAVGFADIAARTPMTTDTLFWVASQTKPITATALMMLVDEGLVNLDDPVETYLPEFAGQMVIVEQNEEHKLLKKPSHPITIRNVLSHTSGLPFLTPVEQPYIDGLALRDATRIYALLPLQTEPDTEYKYSNIGINIAGRIIEVASGQSYENFLQDRLFDPLGLTDTTFWPDKDQLDRLAKSYKPNEEKTALEAINISSLQYPLDNLARFATPGGGLFSTAKDMARFCQMILNGGEFEGKHYLSQASIQEMTRRQTREGLESYGLGWKVRDEGFGHGGAYFTSMVIAPQHGLLTVFLVQHAGFTGEGGSCQEAFHNAVKEGFL